MTSHFLWHLLDLRFVLNRQHVEELSSKFRRVLARRPHGWRWGCGWVGATCEASRGGEKRKFICINSFTSIHTPKVGRKSRFSTRWIFAAVMRCVRSHVRNFHFLVQWYHKACRIIEHRKRKSMGIGIACEWHYNLSWGSLDTNTQFTLLLQLVIFPFHQF